MKKNIIVSIIIFILVIILAYIILDDMPAFTKKIYKNKINKK